MTRRCAVLGCAYKYYPPADGCIHVFPNDSTLRQLWYVRSGSNLDFSKLGFYGLCSNHFSKLNYKDNSINKKRSLTGYALPDQNLPTINPDGCVFMYDAVSKLLEDLRTLSTNDELKNELTVVKRELLENTSQLKNLQKHQDNSFQERVHEKFGKMLTRNQIDLVISDKSRDIK